jgi:acetylornithine deacetylase
MDSVALIDFTRALIDIDSTTGREGEAGAFISSHLRSLGYTVIEQPVSPGMPGSKDRFNILATVGDPVVMLSTHFDCVPAFFKSRIEGDRLHGRGSSDAKGTLAAQIAACERLRQGGETRAGLLFVVGEERGSDGAVAANTLAKSSSRFLVNGEPTDNRLGAATRGVYRVKLVAKGRAAHSSRPDLGVSAIDKLVDALVALRGVEWPADPVLGLTHYNVGVVAGGVAPNVIPADASAELLFRSVGDERELLTLIKSAADGLVVVEEVLTVPPVRLKLLDGFKTAVFSYTTDIPFLDRWGTPLLLGPGSVEMAHTADESVAIAELHEAVDLYVGVVRTLLTK